MRRVVVTGIGLVTPLGCGTDLVWQRLLAGQSGITPITSFDVSDISSRIAGLVPRSNGEALPGEFDADAWFMGKEQRRMDTFIQFGVVASTMAVEDAGWTPEDEESLERTGVIIGAGIGGLPEIEKGALVVNNEKVRKLSPFFIPASLINLVSGQVAIKHGFKGPNHAVVTACSSGPTPSVMRRA
jgi:3-oxoacyl-[acyl-carrier-protein] synthase II